MTWLDFIFKDSSKIREFLNFTFKLLSRVRDYNIISLVIVLIIVSIINLYFLSIFIYNLEGMCKLYLSELSNNK